MIDDAEASRSTGVGGGGERVARIAESFVLGAGCSHSQQALDAYLSHTHSAWLYHCTDEAEHSPNPNPTAGASSNWCRP